MIYCKAILAMGRVNLSPTKATSDKFRILYTITFKFPVVTASTCQTSPKSSELRIFSYLSQQNAIAMDQSNRVLLNFRPFGFEFTAWI